MKLEVGKFYKTRGGEKVEILRKLNVTSAYRHYPFMGVMTHSIRGECEYTWAEDGRASMYIDHPYDIVGPWVESRPRMIAYFEQRHNSVESRIRMYPAEATAPKGWVRAPWLDEPEEQLELIEEHA